LKKKMLVGYTTNKEALKMMPKFQFQLSIYY
jgi:hypothetical protein